MHGGIINLSKPNAIDSTKNHAQGKSLRILKELFRIIQKVAHQDFGLMILILPKSRRLLRSQELMVESSE